MHTELVQRDILISQTTCGLCMWGSKIWSQYFIHTQTFNNKNSNKETSFHSGWNFFWEFLGKFQSDNNDKSDNNKSDNDNNNNEDNSWIR